MRKAYSYIRMSTDLQKKGDSLRRQLDASEAYARNNGLQLVDSIDGRTLHDIGVSGYKGRNSQKGVLAVFLEALENGRIEKDAVLLVESLDRLSRDKLTEALVQFISILNAGIEIVTIADNQCYTKESINQDQGKLFISLAIMFRANEESEMKSLRLQSVWQNKREKAAERPLTSVSPAWLRYSKKLKKFEEIPERVEVVRKIFTMCANTTGLYGIARHLNETKVPVFGRGQLWHRSYISKIVTNRAVLGEFQPQKRINGKSTPVGDPIKNYYPEVLTEEEFHLANAAISSRTMCNRGRKGKVFTNLFSGLAYCSRCGAKMSLRDRGKPPKGGRYLVCLRQRASAGCDMPELKMEDFESAIITHLSEVDFSSLSPESTSPISQLEDAIVAAEQHITEKEKEFERQVDIVGMNDLSEEAKVRLIKRINDIAVEIDAIKLELEVKQRQLNQHVESKKILHSDEIKILISKLEEKKDDYFFRSSVNQILHKAIQRIDVVNEPFVFLPYEYKDDDEEVISYRALFKKREKIPLNELVLRPKFKEHCERLSLRLIVLYKNSAVRHIDMGRGTTFKFSRTFDKKPLPSIRLNAK